MIKLSNFGVGYRQRVLLGATDVRFEIGTVTALVGRNGSGKSTMLRALAGLEPYTGTICVDGVDMRGAKPAQRAHLVSYVSTKRVLIPGMTCLQAVEAGRAPHTGFAGTLSSADRRIALQALQSVGMEEFGARYLDTLSDGECQRVMVARALAQDTPVILLDEPTSFLDIPARYALCSLLAELAHTHSKCILYSTHELNLALRFADTVALLHDSRLQLLPTVSTDTRAQVAAAFGLADLL